MIHDSNPWKTELLANASWLQRLRISEKTTEATHIKIEKTIFFSAYAIRKLIESRKLSDFVVEHTFALEFFPAKRRVTLLNRAQIDDNYDFEARGVETRNLSYVCNQLIHSYSFAPETDEVGRISAVLMASDWVKSSRVLRLSRSQFLGILRLVGRDAPSEMRYSINEAGKEIVSLG